MHCSHESCDRKHATDREAANWINAHDLSVRAIRGGLAHGVRAPQQLQSAGLLDGLVNAVVELMRVSLEEAKVLTQRWTEEDWPIQNVYSKLQHACAPMILVPPTATARTGGAQSH